MKLRTLTPALLLAACSAALGIEQSPADRLSAAFPGIQFHYEQGRLQNVYGVPMNAAPDARSAANLWIASYGDVFNCGRLSALEDWSTPTLDNLHTIFTYQQFIGGVPVEYGMLKVMVLNGPTPRVVYAAGTLAPAPASGAFPAPSISAEAAFSSIRDLPAWKSFSVWSKPTLVIWQGNGDWVAPVLAWKFTGENPDPATAACRTFFVDALTGSLAGSRNEVAHDDVTGTFQGQGLPWRSPGCRLQRARRSESPQSQGRDHRRQHRLRGPLGRVHHRQRRNHTCRRDLRPEHCGRGRPVVQHQLILLRCADNHGKPARRDAPGPATFLLNNAPSEHLTSQINGTSAPR
jgi:hypothetical protein